MKTVASILAVLVALLIGLAVQQHFRAAELERSVTALTRDREAVQAELRKLSNQVAELLRRPVATAAGDSATGGSRAATGDSARTEATAAAVQRSAPAARPGVTVTAPAGWGKNGSKTDSYTVGVDSTQSWGGMPSAYVESHSPSVDGFGGMMQTISAEDYAGKRVRLSGWVKTEEANQGGGHLWLRIDGQERGAMLGFDNMDNRAVKGTQDWQEASIVLDVPAGSAALAYGFFVSGGGKMWVNGQRIEEVGSDVPVTNMLSAKRPALPKAPANLGFDPNRPK
ncbi:MAG: hypothetical protein HZA93_22035 [Verrucomicrobia bacterium]|nr:hypothetical protein [Verrucomicrobiota bacterium]